MKTGIEFFLKVTPCDLYRLGNSTASKLDVVRTSPPRPADEKVDIESFVGPDGGQWVDAKTGGVSLFDQRSLRFGKQWYVVPANTEIPLGLVISRDDEPKVPGDALHYSIRPVYNMPLVRYVGLLRLLLPHAKPAFFTTSPAPQSA